MKNLTQLIILMLLFVSINDLSAQKNKKNAPISPPTPTLLDLNNPDDAVKADRKIASQKRNSCQLPRLQPRTADG